MLVFFGDSITVGAGASAPANSYANLVAAHYGMTEDNRAVGSSQLWSQSRVAYGISPSTSVPVIGLLGYNDVAFFGSDPNGQAYYQNALRATIAWLATSTKVKARDVAASNWSYASNGIGLTSTVNGATLNLSIAGPTLYVAFRKTLGASSGGTFVTFVDGVRYSENTSVGNTPCYQAASAVGAVYPETDAPAVLRISGLSSGAHAVQIIVDSPSGYTAMIDGVWSNAGAKPAFYLGNTLRSLNAQSAPYNKASDAATSQFNAIAANAVAEFSTDGLAVHLVDASSVYDPTTQVSSDQIHPGDAGHAAIATKTESVIGSLRNYLSSGTWDVPSGAQIIFSNGPQIVVP